MWQSKHPIDLTKINTTGLKNSPLCYPLETETLMSSWERSRERFSKSGSPFDLPTFASIASINQFDSSSRVLKVFWPANWFFCNCLGVHEKAFHPIDLNLCYGFFQLSLYCRTVREIAEKQVRAVPASPKCAIFLIADILRYDWLED